MLVGLGIFIFGIVVRRRLNASESWPKTAGVVRESAVEPQWVKVGSGNMYVVSPKVLYEYEVEGRKYSSSQLSLIERNTANENLAREKSERHPVGQQVTVYYNPQKPEFATLEVGDPTGGKLPFGMMTVGAAAVISGIVWLMTKFK